jgi:Protein of unknown function (DUF3304)
LNLKKRPTGLFVVVAVFLAGCSSLHANAPETVVIPKRVELGSGDTKALNYTPWYIHTFSISGPKGSGIGGGGANMMPMYEDGTPSEGGAKCCTSYPIEWQPDLRLTVRWKADKKQDGKTPGYWYKAERRGGSRVRAQLVNERAPGFDSVACRT